MGIRQRLTWAENRIKSLEKFQQQTLCKHFNVQFDAIYDWDYRPMYTKKCRICEKVLEYYDEEIKYLVAQKEHAEERLTKWKDQQSSGSPS